MRRRHDPSPLPGFFFLARELNTPHPMHPKEIVDCLLAGCGQAHCDELAGHSVEQALHLLKQPDYSEYIPTDGRYPPVPAAASVGSTILAQALGRAAHAQHKVGKEKEKLQKAVQHVQGAVQHQAPDRAAVLASLATMSREVNNLEHALTALQSSLSLKTDQASQDLHKEVSNVKSTALKDAAAVKKVVKVDKAFDEKALSKIHAEAAQAASAQAAEAAARCRRGAGGSAHRAP